MYMLALLTFWSLCDAPSGWSFMVAEGPSWADDVAMASYVGSILDVVINLIKSIYSNIVYVWKIL